MKNFLNSVGNSPLIQLKKVQNINFYVKLELYNPTGSVKDRAASYIINKLICTKEINESYTLIESSSGNFGVSLSAYCNENNLKFICVVDPAISPINEYLITSYGAKLVKVNEPDKNGGYLINRLKKVQEYLENNKNIYWVNQYNNRYNAEAYYMTLGQEITHTIKNIDYVFIGVSSGGTITGISNRIKKDSPNTKIIAVDVEGSVIFGNAPRKRYIPGIGSSIVPGILKNAKIDEVIIVDETETIESCLELLNTHNIFAGGSSGSVYAAIKKYFLNKNDKKYNVVTIFADRGERYTNSIYNTEWCEKFIKKSTSEIIMAE